MRLREHPTCIGNPRRRRIRAAFWGLVATTLASGASAEPMTRGRALALALAQNPQIAAARAQVHQSEARQRQAGAANYPTLTVTAGVGPSLQAKLESGTAVGSTENAYGDVGFDDLSLVIGGQLQLLQPLYTFGKISHRAEAAAHETRAREAQTAITSADVGLEVAKLYEGWLLARDLNAFFKETLHWLTRTIEDTKEQVAGNTGATEQDVVRLEAGIGAIKLGQNHAGAAIRQAEAGLVAYLGISTTTELQPEEASLELLPSAPPALAALEALAKAQRPELTALNEGALAYQKLADAEAADDLPDFFAMVFASGAYTPGRDLVQTRFVVDPLNHFVPGALVGLRWNFSLGGMATERAQENHAKSLELQHIRQWATQGLSAQVTLALEAWKRAQKDVAAASEAVDKAKKWAVRASADYSIGLGNSRDVADAATAYVQLRVAYFDAIYRHNVALASLAKATGTLNSLDSRFYPTKN